MADVPRIILTAHDGTALGDLDPMRVVSIVVTSEVNGENAMTITTTQELAKGDRLLWRDGRGYWHEYVVEGAESVHDMHDATMHTYWCPWSVQHDLECTFVTGMPGTGGTPASARDALTAALAGTARWAVGTVGVTTTGSASFWRMSGWEALQTLVEVWGGEAQATITVSTTGVVSRAVDLLVHVGASTASRRFDYGGDVSGITRTLEDQLWTARVMPLGAGEETTSGGYGRKITIESVNGGVAWLENASAVPLVRVPDGNGGWEVPLQVVENGDMKTPAELKAWATAHLDEWTTPKVSYEADVVQLARAGMDALGVSLGDQVTVVDRTFGSTPLRIEGRVLRIEEDLLDPTATVLTVSNLRGSLASTLDSLARATADVRDMVEGMSANQSSVEWVSNLISRINAEANATGGYTYITEGQGTRTYDVAVSDPLVGAEASQVVEIKGGNIRIANTKDAQGNWEWKTMLQSGYVNSEVIRAMGSGSGGIAEVTANGFLIYLGQALMAAFMADAVKFYDGLGTALTNIIAQFGASGSRVGYSNNYHVDMNSGGIDLYNADVNRTVNINNDVTLISNDYGGGIDFCPDSTLGVATLEGAVSQRTLFTSPNAIEQLYTKIGSSIAQIKLVSAGASGNASSAVTVHVTSEGPSSASHLISFDTIDGLSVGAPILAEETIRVDGSTIYIDNGQRGYHGSRIVRTYLQAVEGEDYNTTRLGTHRESYGVDIYNNLNLTIDDEGNRSVVVSEVAPWLRTFGLDGTGDLLTESPSSVSVASSTWTTLGSITVTKGIWVFSISTTFADNSSGRRAVYFGNSSTGNSVTVGAMGSSTMAPASGAMTKYSNCHIGNVTNANGDTYYCRAWQNSGSSLSCQCYLRAVRIK